MKKNKRLDKVVDQAVALSVKDGLLVEEVILNNVKGFKTLSAADAIYALSAYVKGLKRIKDKSTLKIEASSPLNDSEVVNIKKLVSEKHEISAVEFKENPSLLGGLRLKIGDNVYDYSVKDKISQVRDAISLS